MDHRKPTVDPPLFELDRVTRRFGPREAVAAVDLRLRAGEILAIVGPSGAGKTTLLRLLNALDEPDGGTIRYDGRPLEEWDVPALRREVGMVFQTPIMLGGTVRDNLRLPLSLLDPPAEPEQDRVIGLLSGIDLNPGVLDQPAETLSVGQQQRVAFVRALMLRPRALLLDEPTASLDPTTAHGFLDRVREISRAEGLTVVLVTHQTDHVRRIADRVVLLIDGRVRHEAEVPAFFASSDPLVTDFLGGRLEPAR